MSAALPPHRLVGERAVLLELPDNSAARRLAGHARAVLGDAAHDVVCGHETVLVVGRERRIDVAALARWASAPAAADDGPRDVELRVRYDGPDLAEVAGACSMSPEELVRRHAAAAYTVAFVGFAPGFAYLLGGDPRIRPPRRDEPRPRVPAGAVAVAGEYSAVYPRASPGGWNLLGHTGAVMFDPARTRPGLALPGDTVHFVADRDA